MQRKRGRPPGCRQKRKRRLHRRCARIGCSEYIRSARRFCNAHSSSTSRLPTTSPSIPTLVHTNNILLTASSLTTHLKPKPNIPCHKCGCVFIDGFDECKTEEDAQKLWNSLPANVRSNDGIKVFRNILSESQLKNMKSAQAWHNAVTAKGKTHSVSPYLVDKQIFHPAI